MTVYIAHKAYEVLPHILHHKTPSAMQHWLSTCFIRHLLCLVSVLGPQVAKEGYDSSYL